MTQANPDNITQQPFDQFSKQFFHELFEPLMGEIKINYEVHAERRYVDIYWLPSPKAPQTDFQALGLLGNMVSQTCLLEPFHSPLQPDDINNCLLKLLMVQSVPEDKAEEKAKKEKPQTEKLPEKDKPKKTTALLMDIRNLGIRCGAGKFWCQTPIYRVVRRCLLLTKGLEYRYSCH